MPWPWYGRSTAAARDAVGGDDKREQFWADITMTMRYAHLSAEARRKAVQLLDGANGTLAAHERHITVLPDTACRSAPVKTLSSVPHPAERFILS